MRSPQGILPRSCKILSALTPRPAPHHHVGTNKSAETRKAESPSAKPVSTAQPVPAPRPIELQPPPGAAAPDPIARMIEKAPPAPEAQPDPTSNLLQTTRASKSAKPAKAPRSVQVEPVRAVPAIDGPSLARPAPLVETQPASEPVSKPVRTSQTAKKAKPAQLAQPIVPPQFEVAQAVGKAVPAEPPFEMAQPVFMQVAILGAPNLKAALPAENALPTEAPADEPRGPAARPEPKSACNGGRRVVSAYYWEGRHTASGQPFNPRGLTAAHRTLPFGTRLNVTNPRTGKTVNVLINDRGPFVRGVSLDLSLGAAQAIGLQGTGSVCIL
jgi:rare lipoprotein A